MILFCYGTLEIPDVIETITRKTFASAAAIAPNYARYMLKKEEYPGLVAEEGNETPGTAYFDVDDISMKKIAQYEDTCYELRTILITANGTEHQALAFVVNSRAQGCRSTSVLAILICCATWPEQRNPTRFLLT